ncbi:uncharacterized protein LOC113341880 [Papaver somniferum]|uniref:uncharacterized protein LOC113341880 n=1 Tax=Papaver somniferum TaxID=3469 RepID=UPI000E703170|nr:uncharacterized protein LOC113341880 [Papaver somniferum]
MVNELHIKCKDGNLGLKLDISQAFDTVSWSFVLEVFRRYGFSEDWCSWIHNILKFARISILLSGSPEGFFKITRGLRQGDPLSLLIFILIEDVLSRNIIKLFQNKDMTHIGNMKSVRNLVKLLEVYQCASGQRVCGEKSKIYYGGGSLSRRQAIDDFLGMSITNFPDRYLGVKVLPGVVKYRHISNVVDKLKEQLSVMKGKMLSFQNRVVLIKSVFSSYSIHNMAVYKWPVKFIQQCDRAIRNFLWSGDSNLSRYFVVGYDKICIPVKEGGLGLCSLKTMNQALLMKLWWNIKSSGKNWARFLESKFTCRDGRIKVAGVKSSILPGIRWVHNDVVRNNKCIIGDRRSTSLFFDVWYGVTTLDDVLGRYDLDRGACVSDIIQ